MRLLAKLFICAAGAFTGSSPASALACPRCPVGEAARAAAFDERFWPTVGALLLPLIIIVGIVIFLYGSRPASQFLGKGAAHAAAEVG